MTSSWLADKIERCPTAKLRLMKNYTLAKGIIDKSDYIVENDNEMRDLVQTLTQEDFSALELKFYPIIPNVINVLTAEFAKRNTKITFR